MRRRYQRLWTKFALIPLMGLCSLSTCQADVMRDVADSLDEEANEIDGSRNDLDLGDYLSDLVKDL